MADILSDKDLDTIFRAARSHNRWTDEAVSDVQIQAIYDLLRWGPTSANCSPARFCFVKSAPAKARLAACVMPGNKEKVLTAPVVAIIGEDMKFYDKIPRLFPHNPKARDWFAGDAKVAEATAFRNATLQGAYLIIAARALGLDCGPMSGFDNAAVDAAFFAGTDIRSNFLCAIGHGSGEGLFARAPRLDFDEACRIL
ncbi:MAG: malonic semialdehyde reductase [Pseudomonadota bacterium]|jgi:3-hydroxypropanoate dehydrogenase